MRRKVKLERDIEKDYSAKQEEIEFQIKWSNHR